MIIDVHTHGYTAPVIADPRGWALSRGELYWANIVAPEEGKSLQGWADCGRMIRDMDSTGIDKAVLLGWYWQKEKTCREQNEWHLQWRNDHPDRFLAFASVQPGAGESAYDDVRRAVDEGCSGIGEMHPKVQGFERENPIWLKILSWAEEIGIPVNMHVTEPAGHDYRGKVETPLEDFIFLATNFPKLKFILAHWGGGLPFYELNPECRKRLSNVFYDTAASPLLYDARIWSRVESVIGAERILFGSDYPLCLYPESDRKPGWRKLLDEVSTSGLPEEKILKILGENAMRLFT